MLLATCPINCPPFCACNVAAFACSLAKRVLSALFRVLAAICSMLAAVWINDADCCSVFTDSSALRDESCSASVMAVCEEDLISLTSVAMLLDKLLIPGIKRPAQLLPNSGIETPRLPDVTSSILFFTVLIGVTRYFVMYAQSKSSAMSCAVFTAIKSDTPLANNAITPLLTKKRHKRK